MPITKATQEVISPNICTTDTTQTITGVKTFSNAIVGNVNGDIYASDGTTKVLENGTGANATFTGNVTGNVTATNISTTNLVNGTSLCFRNKIINGAMTIDQRNSGSSVTQTTATLYPVDRFLITGSVSSKFTAQQNQGSVTPPAGYAKYLGTTSSSSYSVAPSDFFCIAQKIEGFNVADLGFGTANASPVTLSFWIRSSLTGTFGGSLRNNGTRSYPFNYTISSANTWTQITITISGDTTGTWLSNNGEGLTVFFSLGSGSTLSGTAGSWQAGNFVSATGATSVVGTNGATFYITGVQLEAGSVATPFENRPIGTELALCQRYCWQTNGGISAPGLAGQPGANLTNTTVTLQYPVTMRSIPTFTNITNGAVDSNSSLIITSAAPDLYITENSVRFVVTTATNIANSIGYAAVIRGQVIRLESEL